MLRTIDKEMLKKVYSFRMFDSLTVRSPAKINLVLHVLPRRADGYHNIESIFTTVSLGDEIIIAPTNLKNTCSVECREMSLPRENTFTAAYKAFCVLTGVDDGVSVTVTKHIPAGGGLGGGSSDASSFIKSIDTLFGTQLSSTALISLAGEVGSDCYFFMQALLARESNPSHDFPSNNFAAVVTGRGEVVKQIAVRNDYEMLLVLPNVSVSTKEAYARGDECNLSRNDVHCNRGENGEGCHKALVDIYGKPVHEWCFVNDFTAPVCRAFPKINEALEAVKKSGADFADMSGSGSTVFGVYETREKVLQAQEVLS